MEDEKIILASGSPRRRELLSMIGIDFDVIVSEAEEVVTKREPEDIVMELSALKAYAVASLPRAQGRTVLGSDTIVWLDGTMLGKPKDRDDARRMLKELQGRSHSVFTGVTIVNTSRGIRKQFFRETKVYVHSMSDAEIEWYLDTGAAFDKAGAYGIQGPFAAFVDRIEGDYNTVVGLPVAAVYQVLREC